MPESVFPRPASRGVSSTKSALVFKYKSNPFSFSVSRAKTGEVIFDSSAAQLVFQSQYLRLRTKLPENPNLYGLGEHSDPFRLKTTGYIRTLWSQDSFGTPENSNLYGNHPVYFEHRKSGTHGVFLLNSNGMDIKIDKDPKTGQYLEYNTLGGVADLYFMAGPGPIDVSRQYAEIAGPPAMMPYWGLGFHQCRYGYRDIFEVVSEIGFTSIRHTLPSGYASRQYDLVMYSTKSLLTLFDPGRSGVQLQCCWHPPGNSMDRYRLHGPEKGEYFSVGLIWPSRALSFLC